MRDDKNLLEAISALDEICGKIRMVSEHLQDMEDSLYDIQTKIYSLTNEEG